MWLSICVNEAQRALTSRRHKLSPRDLLLHCSTSSKGHKSNPTKLENNSSGGYYWLQLQSQWTLSPVICEPQASTGNFWALVGCAPDWSQRPSLSEGGRQHRPCILMICLSYGARHLKLTYCIITTGQTNRVYCKQGHSVFLRCVIEL